MLTLQFLVAVSGFYSMARFILSFVTIDNYAGRSDSLGIIKWPAKR